MRKFAGRVKRFRMMNGMTQKQLAKAMHVSLRTVQNIEAFSNEPRYSAINAFRRLEERYAAEDVTAPLAATGALTNKQEDSYV